MIKHRGYRIELKLNENQRHNCSKSAGTARYAYNWKLEQLTAEYEANKALATMYGLKKVPSTFSNSKTWHKEWVIFKEDHDWIYETSKCTGQEALRDLETAFKRFFKGLADYPKFKKKGSYDSFTLTGAIYIGYDWVQLPNIGIVKLKEHGYYPVAKDSYDQISEITVSRQADHWFISFNTEEENANTLPKLEDITVDEMDVVGVDLGVKTLGVTSYGRDFKNPKAYKAKKQRLARYQRSISRKKKGSKNRKKSVIKLARLHKRIADIREDASHQMTTAIVKAKPKLIVIEALKPENMAKNRKLAESILDASFGRIKVQFVYKSEWEGCRLLIADTFFPSSKLCSHCGHYHKELKLIDREWDCPVCKAHHDRDLNAARNLRFYGLWFLDLIPVSSSGIACLPGEAQANVDWISYPEHRDGRLQFLTERCSSKKQEFKYDNTMLYA